MVRGEIPTPFNPPENEPIRKVFQRQRVPDHVHQALIRKDRALVELSKMDQSPPVVSLSKDMSNHHRYITSEFGIGGVSVNTYTGRVDVDEVTIETTANLVDWRMSTASYIEDDPVVDYADELFDCLVHEERRDAKQRVKKMS